MPAYEKERNDDERKAKHLEQDGIKHPPELVPGKFGRYLGQEYHAQDCREARGKEVRDLPNALPDTGGVPAELAADIRADNRQHNRVQQHGDKPHRGKGEPRGTHVQHRFAKQAKAKARTASDPRGKNPGDNGLRRNNAQHREVPGIEEKRHPDALEQRRGYTDKCPAFVFAQAIQHRRGDGNHVHRDNSRKREQDGRLYQARVNSWKKRLERSQEAEKNCRNAGKNRREHGEPVTAPPDADQLCAVSAVLRGKADPAILHGKRRHCLPDRHQVL